MTNHKGKTPRIMVGPVSNIHAPTTADLDNMTDITGAFDTEPVGDVLRFAGKLYHWTRSPAGNLMTVPVFDADGKRVMA